MFKRTIKEAFRWSTKWYFGSITTSAGTFFLMEKYFEFERLRSIKYGVTIFIFTFLIKVIIQYLKEIDKLESKIDIKDEKIDTLNTRQNKQELVKNYNYYGETILLLKDSFSYIHKVRRGDNITPEQLSKVFIGVCNKLKHIFEKRLDYTYSVCIKVLTENGGELNEYVEIKTLCRDENSYFNRKNCKQVVHKIVDNTCFNEILYNIDMPNKAFYLNNNLPNDKYYKNSSFLNYGTVPEQADSIERQKFWTLPYKSEIVVPIAPTLNSDNDRKKEFYGYLCVDCDEENGFHKKYDSGMIQGVADGLSDLIKIWKQQKN
ncbi:MAG: hypothetical protein PHR79_02635 [Bacteroidales bacterium]|nr:hypothetical protein [Bacteroidales bacterium]